MLFIGLDPGGFRRFGWALLHVDSSGAVEKLDVGVATSAALALEDIRMRIRAKPMAVGIDAPLFWVYGPDRRADRLVRTLLTSLRGNPLIVRHVDALHGASVVQGVLAARQSSDLWPRALVTEAHPRALWQADAGARDFLKLWLPEARSEDERDAALAAYAAWSAKGRAEGWEDLFPAEESPFVPSGTTVSYWFPMVAHAPMRSAKGDGG